MRVLHAVPAYFPSQGGIETLVRSVVRRLNLTGDWDFAILVPNYIHTGRSAEAGRQPFFGIVDGVRVHQIPVDADPSALSPRETLKLLSLCRQTIEQFRPDLIHSHGVTLLTVPLAIMAARYDVPLIWHLHGGLPKECPSVLLQLLRDAPHLLTPSHFVRGEIERAVGRTSDVRVLYNGIDLDECNFYPIRSPDERRGIIMVGRLEKEKGFDVGLSAVAPLLRSNNIRLRIVGIGPELPTLRNLAASLGVESLVKFTGLLSHSDTLSLMAEATVLIAPSTQIEGFGLVAAEAGALGVPVIASRVGGLQEVVIDGQTGQLVEVGDVPALSAAIAKYLKDPALIVLHGENGRRHVRACFDISVYVELLARIYYDVTRTIKPNHKE